MSKKKGYKPANWTTHDEDKALVVSAIDGDRKSYETLLQKYKPIIYTAAKRRLPYKNVEDLEDITMIVLGNSFLKLQQYDPEKSKFFTWMVACLHNYVNGIPKQKKRVSTYSIEDSLQEVSEKEDAFNFDTNIDREQLSVLVRTLIDKLPADIATAITMKYFKDASHREIADAIDCDETYVWYKLEKGRKMLKKLSSNNKLFL